MTKIPDETGLVIDHVGYCECCDGWVGYLFGHEHRTDRYITDNGEDRADYCQCSDSQSIPVWHPIKAIPFEGETP